MVFLGVLGFSLEGFKGFGIEGPGKGFGGFGEVSHVAKRLGFEFGAFFCQACLNVSVFRGCFEVLDDF